MRILFLILLLVSPMAYGQTALPDRPLAEQQQEQRARNLFHQLRCEMCQGQTIGDSNALLAQDMRALVREKVQAGENDEAILGYFSARYGSDILMRPPLDARTAPLWLAPLIAILLGGWLLIRYFSRKPRME